MPQAADCRRPTMAMILRHHPARCGLTPAPARRAGGRGAACGPGAALWGRTAPACTSTAGPAPVSLLALGGPARLHPCSRARLRTRRTKRGLALEDSAPVLRPAALADFSARYATGAGPFLVAHSLPAASSRWQPPTHRVARPVTRSPTPSAGRTDRPGRLRARQPPRRRPALGLPQAPGGQGEWRKHWGALRLYPPDAFRLGQALLSPVPEIEAAPGPSWPERYPELAARVRVPVRFTFAEQEQWWRHDEEAVAELTRPFASAPVRVDHQPDAGHNISLGWAARTYHLRVCGFLEECLLARDAALPQRRPVGAAL
ncbi:hypothetical protein SMICM304S_08075 [Streptomyces microflavus]